MKSIQKILLELLNEAKDAEVLYYTPLSSISLDEPYVFRLQFNTRIGNNYDSMIGDNLTVNINDFPLLVQKITNYLDVAQKRYKDEKVYNNLTSSSRAKRRIANLFLNASYSD